MVIMENYFIFAAMTWKMLCCENSKAQMADKPNQHSNTEPGVVLWCVGHTPQHHTDDTGNHIEPLHWTQLLAKVTWADEDHEQHLFSDLC